MTDKSAAAAAAGTEAYHTSAAACTMTAPLRAEFTQCAVEQSEPLPPPLLVALPGCPNPSVRASVNPKPLPHKRQALWP